MDLADRMLVVKYSVGTQKGCGTYGAFDKRASNEKQRKSASFP